MCAKRTFEVKMQGKYVMLWIMSVLAAFALGYGMMYALYRYVLR